VDILLHSALDVGSYGILLDLFCVQSLLCLVLLLCTQRDLCAVYCIEVPNYIAQGYTTVAQCYTVAARFYTIVAQYYTVVVPD
jgi:hypothetical protein